ncbi:glycerophosphodiester phosphodiesterase [Chitinophagaceae bacterium IBVUCB2]|nr:glycerophosphodiester phosphodiesterase [Chitinophagaceae bacterium IBVUCB2]
MTKRSILQYSLALLCFFAACHVSKKTQEINSMKIELDKQGHRGCRGLMPENTVAAMLNAVGMGVTTLEMDVVITKDKKVILSHEPFFNHEITTKPDGSYVTVAEEKALNIYQLTHAETKNYDVGMKPHPRFPQQQKFKVTKPLLSEVIDSVNEYMMTAKRSPLYYNIETKTKPESDAIYHPAPDEFVELLIAVIKEKGIEERVIIQSFDFRTLQYLHQKYPFIKTAMLIEDFDKRSFEEQVRDLGFAPTIYSPAYKLVTEKLIATCHKLGIKIIPWTVNDKAGIDKLKAMGVDGIITDYPNLFNQ